VPKAFVGAEAYHGVDDFPGYRTMQWVRKHGLMGRTFAASNVVKKYCLPSLVKKLEDLFFGVHLASSQNSAYKDGEHKTSYDIDNQKNPQAANGLPEKIPGGMAFNEHKFKRINESGYNEHKDVVNRGKMLQKSWDKNKTEKGCDRS
jgi:hypothetical protein